MSDLNSDFARDFSEDGFVFARGLFSGDEIAGLMRAAKSDQTLAGEAYAKKDASGNATMLAVRNELDHSPYAAIVRSARVAGTMQQLLGAEVYHYHHKMMLKEPRVGGAWEWHQDYGYWYDNGCLYPDMGSCLIAIDRANQANGCLQVLKGSHKMGRIDHLKVGGQTSCDPERVEAAKKNLELVYCEMEPGDAVFFHSNTLHRSDANLGDHPRWSLICCYNTRHNDPIIRDGRHPNYTPLDTWNDEKVRELLLEL